MMYTMPKNLLSICVNFALATQQVFQIQKSRCYTRYEVKSEIQFCL